MRICIKSSLINVLRTAVLPMLLLGVLASATFAQGQLSVKPEQKAGADAINQTRRDHNLYDFKASSILFRIAQQYAEVMASQNNCQHGLDGKTPSDRAQALGYPNFAGECICSFHLNGSPEELAKKAVDLWLASKQGHRGAVLHERDQDMGVGYARNGDIHYFCFNPGQRGPDTNNPPQLVVAGGVSPRPVPVPVVELKLTDLAGEWDWVGNLKFTLRTSGNSLIWKDHTGEYSLTKVAAQTFQFSYGATVKFTGKDTAEFFNHEGNPAGALKRLGGAAFNPTGTWSNGSYTVRLALVEGGLSYADNVGQWTMEKVPAQPNTYKFGGTDIVLSFSDDNNATVTFPTPVQLKRQ